MSATYKDEGHGEYRCLLCESGWLAEDVDWFECMTCAARWTVEVGGECDSEGVRTCTQPGEVIAISKHRALDRADPAPAAEPLAAYLVCPDGSRVPLRVAKEAPAMLEALRDLTAYALRREDAEKMADAWTAARAILDRLEVKP